jgi:hypothetical protein
MHVSLASVEANRKCAKTSDYGPAIPDGVNLRE